MTLRRRSFLASCAALSTAATAGCLGGDGGTDGYAPDGVVPDDPPAAPDVDPASFDAADVDGTAVELVPLDVAHAWYLRREARFADARGRGQYDQAHVAGAAHSPAPDGGSSDPVPNWPASDRIVTYCGCPHHLSTMRGAALVESGYERVYAIDEGFIPWFERGYPMEGSEIQSSLASYDVRGRTDPADAGAMAWAIHEPGDHREATPIQPDGSFAMTLHFGSLPADAPITVRTPSYEVVEPLSAVTATPVTGERA